jgi:ribosomal protein S18 acetylase RimI-like enzyme
MTDPGTRETHAVVRRMRSDEGEQWRRMRLATIRETPIAAGETAEQVEAMTTGELENFAVRASSSTTDCTMFAELDDEIVGMASVAADATPRIWGVWLQGTHRGRGIADLLVHALEHWTAVAVHSPVLTLLVNERNTRAQRFYERLGYAFDGSSRPYRLDRQLRMLSMTKPVSPAETVRTDS